LIAVPSAPKLPEKKLVTAALLLIPAPGPPLSICRVQLAPPSTLEFKARVKLIWLKKNAN
jgi:hypothetical protein